MGRPRKIIEDGAEIETDEAMPAVEIIETPAAATVIDPNARVAYIKNGVTRLRYPADEAELLDQGWKRK